ncbi:TetR/AcrR family transcriptional regulator [Kribbella speibonae]|uniref:TetR/AcrR family transcriptional regulator n=1 Tax=Kribbella speibonae TaxID=1572660 RepID=A0A4R0JKN3_9ACTN|nr:TetR/AcrR family transcriptional regulator [Kribbella speibonae]TCC17481.1 TetR/AcrR family transcriptional regulator [Kribbella speibonae]TCC42375.1 TetR/AcrR family transcriptional regulator [Kribbella speibonae]
MTDERTVGPGRPPVRKKSPAKRSAILAAATAMFFELGYERTSVDAIAASAGVGKQTVYGHFGDKEGLFLAVVEAVRQDQEVAADPGMPDTGDPLADLTAAGESILDGVLSPSISALHRLTIAELPHHPELQRMWRDETAKPGRDDLIAAYLRACDAKGLLKVPDPALVTRQLTFLVVAEGRVATLQGTEPLSADDRHRIAAEAADLIVRACRP